MLFRSNTRGEYHHIKKDANGNVLWNKTNSDDVFFSYDDNGNCVEQSYRNGTSIKFQYDENNNLSKSVNSLGYTEEFEYDENNNLIRKTNSYGLIIEYRYNEFGNLIYEKNSSSKIEKFISYVLINGKYLISSIIDTSGKEERYKYDERGNKIKYFESLFEKNYEYDENNNLIAYSRKYVK